MGTKEKRLRKARKTRGQIATQFDALRRDRVTLEQLLETTPACLRNVSIYDVMMHANNIGPEGIKKCLKKADVWPEDKMGKIPQGDRMRVVECLPNRVRKYEPTHSGISD